MDPATSAAVQEPPSQGQDQGDQRRDRARCVCGCGFAFALNLVLFLAVTVSFAGAAYRARRRPRDLAFVAAAYYLLALLLCCLAKLELMRQAGPAPGDDAQRRRVRLAVWAVSVALSVAFASRVADAMPLLPLKLAVWGVTAAFLALGFYLLFCCQDAECRGGGAELGRSQDDSGSRLAKASRELSPEEMA